MSTLKYMFKFETVNVYQRQEFLMGFSYFWGYEDADKLYGPFSTLADCVKHAEVALYASGRTKTLVKSNVIAVDFKAKRRIS